MTLQTHSVLVSIFGTDQYSIGKTSAEIVKNTSSAIIEKESLSAMLIDLCTGDWSGFVTSKRKLAGVPTNEVCAEATRLLAKNPRSFKLLSIVSHASFFSDWECEEPKTQVILFGALAVHSLNKSLKETSFHRVAKAIRRDVLSQNNSCKPMKLRLRDCHQLIAQFMQEYALVSEANRTIVMTALSEGEVSGCGHLPSQQAVALTRKLARGRKLA